MVFGPADTLERMSKTILEASSPQYHYHVDVQGGHSVFVMVFEEHHKLMNSSISVTLVLHYNGSSVRADIVSTGGRMGFRGSNPEGETPAERGRHRFDSGLRQTIRTDYSGSIRQGRRKFLIDNP